MLFFSIIGNKHKWPFVQRSHVLNVTNESLDSINFSYAQTSFVRVIITKEEECLENNVRICLLKGICNCVVQYLVTHKSFSFSLSDSRWASINRGVLICDECCSIHRGLGRHSSQVRHLTQTPWPSSQLQVKTHAACFDGEPLSFAFPEVH